MSSSARRTSRLAGSAQRSTPSGHGSAPAAVATTRRRRVSSDSVRAPSDATIPAGIEAAAGGGGGLDGAHPYASDTGSTSAARARCSTARQVRRFTTIRTTTSP